MAELTFYGTGIRWLVGRGAVAGKADVHLDGAHIGRVDLHRSCHDGRDSTWLERAGLSLDTHSAMIEVSGEKNPASAGYYIDAFEVVS